MQVPARLVCCWLLVRQKLPDFWHGRVSVAANKTNHTLRQKYCDASLSNGSKTFSILYLIDEGFNLFKYILHCGCS